MTVNRRFLYWGVFLLAAGAVMLVAQGGTLDGDALGQALRYWPIVPIALGVGLLLRRTQFGLAGGVIAAAMPGLLLGGLVVAAPRFVPECGVALPVSGATREGTFVGAASVDVTLACGDLTATPARGTVSTAGSTSCAPSRPRRTLRSSRVGRWINASGEGPMQRRSSRFLRSGLLSVALVAVGFAPAAPAAASRKDDGPLGHFKHIVVIYEENHSFDNLYGNWGSVNGQNVVGRSDATTANTTQLAQDGSAYDCLLQKDVNLTAPSPLATTCGPETVTLGDGSAVTYSSHFANAPYNIDQFIPATATTCPDENHLFSFANGILNGSGLPGGCTRDLVHRFYQEQYQLNGGAMNRYVTGSDSAGMTMGYYDTTKLPIYQYLHQNGAPNYVIADHFFAAAFGGSFLNHQYLVAAAPLPWPTIPANRHSVLDAAGFPNATYPLYKPTTTVSDGPGLQACGLASTIKTLACGDVAVNTVQPPYQPTSVFGTQVPPVDDTTKPMTIGDELSDAGVSWAWYSGGWDNAAGITTGSGWTNGSGTTCSDPNSAPAATVGSALGGFPFCPDKSFQTHHQPLNYFARYAPGQPGRSHLQDEQDFLAAVEAGTLPQVSFVKPLGLDNEHPGYTSEPNGSDHLVDLINAVETGPQAGNTLIVVTYDEFGGQWDHVAPPGLGTSATAGQADLFGPGTRVPAIVIARSLTRSNVDHTVYDTTSILRTIEQQFGLAPLGTRDAAVNDLGSAVAAGRPPH